MSPRLHVRSLRPVVAATGSLALAAGLCLTAAGPASAGATVIAVVVGIVVWAAIAFWAHGAYIGVKPFGR